MRHQRRPQRADRPPVGAGATRAHGPRLGSESLFGSAAELTAVPYLQARYGGKAPERVGLKHPTTAPYGAFTCADGRDIAIAIQNEREWADFRRIVLWRVELLHDVRCADNAACVATREFVDGSVAEVSAGQPSTTMVARLAEAQTAFANVNSVYDLIEHPQNAHAPHDGARTQRRDASRALGRRIGAYRVRRGAGVGCPGARHLG